MTAWHLQVCGSWQNMTGWPSAVETWQLCQVINGITSAARILHCKSQKSWEYTSTDWKYFLESHKTALGCKNEIKLESYTDVQIFSLTFPSENIDRILLIPSVLRHFMKCSVIIKWPDFYNWIALSGGWCGGVVAAVRPRHCIQCLRFKQIEILCLTEWAGTPRPGPRYGDTCPGAAVTLSVC